MGVQAYTLKAGTTGKLFLVFAHGMEAPSPAIGLRHDTPGARAAYVREGAKEAVPIPLSEGRPGVWSPGGFVEIDRELVPGMYQFGVPDDALAPGSTRAVLMVTFPDARMDPIDIDLVAFDAQDDVRLGMSALGPQGRLEALRGAFPMLAKRELEELAARRSPD